MNKIKLIFLTLVISFSFSLNTNSKPVPASFADLAEKLMPSVVNISTTTTITTNSNPFPFQFPPGSPFEDMFKEFGTPQERQSAALGSGFIIPCSVPEPVSMRTARSWRLRALTFVQCA